MDGQALQDGCREVERLKACLSAAETVLGAADGEVVEAKATDAAARAELAGELIFVFIASIAGLLLPWSDEPLCSSAVQEQVAAV